MSYDSEETINQIVPNRILNLLRQALDAEMFSEAETLVRVYSLATNMVDIDEYKKLDECYRLWEQVEKKIANLIQNNRRELLRVIK